MLPGSASTRRAGLGWRGISIGLGSMGCGCPVLSRPFMHARVLGSQVSPCRLTPQGGFTALSFAKGKEMAFGDKWGGIVVQESSHGPLLCLLCQAPFYYSCTCFMVVVAWPWSRAVALNSASIMGSGQACFFTASYVG